MKNYQIIKTAECGTYFTIDGYIYNVELYSSHNPVFCIIHNGNRITLPLSEFNNLENYGFDIFLKKTGGALGIKVNLSTNQAVIHTGMGVRVINVKDTYELTTYETYCGETEQKTRHFQSLEKAKEFCKGIRLYKDKKYFRNDTKKDFCMITFNHAMICFGYY